MIGAVNSWKTQAQRVSGVMRSMQDADVWKIMKDSNQESFFFNLTPRRRFTSVSASAWIGLSPESLSIKSHFDSVQVWTETQ
jgi:hypothetical protein